MGIRASVIGIGNLLLRDEGAGIHAITALRERYNLPSGLELVDGGTLGLDLLPYIEGRDCVLLVDAVDFKAQPGTVRIIEGNGVHAFLDTKFSVHQIGLTDMLFAASITGILPEKLCIAGIQPDIIDTGLELSDSVASHMGELLSAVCGKLNSWGVDIIKRS